jgi:ribosomal protein L37AE/L43A
MEDIEQDNRCWKCMSDGEKVRSRRTGITYCTACGFAMDGLGAVSDLSVLDTEPVVNGEENDCGPR